MTPPTPSNTDPIRIVHIINDLEIGGVEVMLANLLSCMDHKSFDAKVVSLTGRGPIALRIEERGIPVRALDMERGKAWPSDLIRLAKWLRQARPHLVQTWMYHANLAGGLASKFSGRYPVIWGIHASHLEPTTTRRQTINMVRLSAKLSNWLPTRIVYCSEVSRRLHKSMGYANNKSLVIPNGFDLETFVPDPQARVNVRAEISVSSETPLIGMVARFDPQKDHENFFRAAGILLSEFPEIRFVLCGAEVTSENPLIRKWITENGLSDRCHLLGYRRDVAQVMTALDLLSTSSSYGEAFPMVVGEAMACGVPCVVTDIGDSALIVGDAGLSVPPRDPEALAGAWGNLLRKDAATRRRLGEAARSRITEYYSLRMIAHRYESLYRDLVE